MSRVRPIRRHLLTSWLVVIVVLSGVIVTTHVTAARRQVRRLSAALTAQTIAETELRLRSFFAPVDGGLRVLRAWGESDLLDPEDVEGTFRLLQPFLDRSSHVASLIAADGRGRELMILREGAGWSARETRLDEWGQRARLHRWSDAEPEPRVSWQEIDHDPRERAWYRQALESEPGTVRWTEPYDLVSNQAPGITASTRFVSGDGVEHVIAMDVMLVDVSAFTMALAPTEHGRVTVFTEDFALVGLPQDPTLTTPEARRAALLRQPRETGVPVVVEAAEAFRLSEATEPIRFRSQGAWWWGAATLFELGPQRRLWIAALVPESDLLGDLTRRRVLIAAVVLGVFAIAVLQAFRLARRVSRPIEALVLQIERIRHGDLEPGEPVPADVAEVRELVRAQEEMRAALQTLWRIERDLRFAREIQQDSLPDQLPTLAGFELDAWSDPADETGGDSYDVIGYRRGGERDTVAISTGEADRALLLLADASGHGIGPALSASQVRAMLRMAVRAGESLEGIVRHVNAQLFEDLGGGRFVTAWLGEIDARAGTLRTFSAGQAPILRWHDAGGRLEALGADAPPLGISESMEVSVRSAEPLAPGDWVAVCSDGIFDATNPGGEPFGVERVVAALSAEPKSSAAARLLALRRALEHFTAGEPPADDRTALLVRRV